MVILWLLVQQFLISASHMTKTTLITLPLVFHFMSTQIYAIWGIIKIHTLYVNQWIKDRLGSCPRLMGWLKTSLIIVDSSSLSLTGCSTVPSVIEYLKTTIFHSFLFSWRYSSHSLFFSYSRIVSSESWWSIPHLGGKLTKTRRGRDLRGKR